jgi:hypothetical protein
MQAWMMRRSRERFLSVVVGRMNARAWRWGKERRVWGRLGWEHIRFCDYGGFKEWIMGETYEEGVGACVAT